MALTCTSGTAAANFAPGGDRGVAGPVPLIVLTADRPAELREVGAGQAIDQLKLYGDAVKWFFEVGVTSHAGAPALDPHARLPGLLDRAGRAGRARCTSTSRCASRSSSTAPLPADPGPDARTAGPGSGACRARCAVADRARAAAARRDRGGPGRARRRPWRREVPPSRSARLSAAGRSAVGRPPRERGDRPLRPAATRAGVHDPASPELVIRVGDLPTSKPLRAWLAGLTDAEQIALDPEAAWQDPAAAVPRSPRGARTRWRRFAEGRAPRGFGWPGRRPTTPPPQAIDRVLGDQLSEPAGGPPGSVSGWRRRRRCSWPPRCRSATSNVLPVRRALPRVLSDRGANGIDGTVSSAFGAAAARRPVVLLIGDVALAHDIGGLLAARRLACRSPSCC